MHPRSLGYDLICFGEKKVDLLAGKESNLHGHATMRAALPFKLPASLSFSTLHIYYNILFLICQIFFNIWLAADGGIGPPQPRSKLGALATMLIRFIITKSPFVLKELSHSFQKSTVLELISFLVREKSVVGFEPTPLGWKPSMLSIKHHTDINDFGLRFN